MSKTMKALKNVFTFKENEKKHKLHLKMYLETSQPRKGNLVKPSTNMLRIKMKDYKRKSTKKIYS